MGKEKVSVLDGGFPKWLRERHPTDNQDVIMRDRHFTAEFREALVKDVTQVSAASKLGDHEILDARGPERFLGMAPEPRKGLRSGSIKNSFCLPFSELINEDHTFVTKDKIMEKFKSFKFDHDKNIVFSCGSGVTASVLALAYSLINAKYMPTIYDGSWAEYGKN